MIEQFAAVAWALVAGIEDIRHRRIPNALTYGAMLAGVASWLISGSAPLGTGGISVLYGAGVGFLFTIPGYLVGKLGAGDVKLLLAVAFLGGFPAVLTSFVVGALAAGAGAVAWLTLGPRMGRPMAVGGRQLPFGAALALGYIAAVVGGQTGGISWPR